MFLNCLGEYQDVIEVDHHNSFHYQFVEDVVHHSLECGRTVSEAEKHHQGFKETAIGAERCLPFISFLHPDIIEPPPDIQLGEVLRTTKLFDELRDEREWVLVLYCDRV